MNKTLTSMVITAVTAASVFAQNATLAQLGAAGVTETGGTTAYAHYVPRLGANGKLSDAILPASISPAVLSHMVFVDPVAGVDGTGVTGLPTAPFKTLQGAVTDYAYASDTGVSYYLYPGTYATTTLDADSNTGLVNVGVAGIGAAFSVVQAIHASSTQSADADVPAITLTLSGVSVGTVYRDKNRPFTLRLLNGATVGTLTASGGTNYLPKIEYEAGCVLGACNVEYTQVRLHTADAVGYTPSSVWEWETAPGQVQDGLDYLARRKYPPVGVNPGDMIYWEPASTSWVTLAAGAEGTVLLGGAVPSFGAQPFGPEDMTNIVEGMAYPIVEPVITNILNATMGPVITNTVDALVPPMIFTALGAFAATGTVAHATSATTAISATSATSAETATKVQVDANSWITLVNGTGTLYRVTAGATNVYTLATASDVTAALAGALTIADGTALANRITVAEGDVDNLEVQQSKIEQYGTSDIVITNPDAFGFDGGGTITSYDYDLGGAEVVIPYEINGIPVTAIGDFTFSDGDTRIGDPITSVIAPKSATSIGGNAFAGCESLTSVSFPSVTSIGGDAFDSCVNLTSVSFPSVTSIGNGAFYGCGSLTSVSFPSATSIGTYAFEHCESLTSVSFPLVTSISYNAFYYCVSLTSVSFPSVTSIGDFAFADCVNLTSVFYGSNKPTSTTDIYDSSPNVTNYVLTGTTEWTSMFPSTGLYQRPVVMVEDFGMITNNIFANSVKADSVIVDGVDLATTLAGRTTPAAVTNIVNALMPTHVLELQNSGGRIYIDNSVVPAVPKMDRLEYADQSTVTQYDYLSHDAAYELVAPASGGAYLGTYRMLTATEKEALLLEGTLSEGEINAMFISASSEVTVSASEIANYFWVTYNNFAFLHPPAEFAASILTELDTVSTAAMELADPTKWYKAFTLTVSGVPYQYVISADKTSTVVTYTLDLTLE